MSRELLQDGQWPTRNGRGTGPHASQEMAELGGDGVCLRFLRDAQLPVTAALCGLDPGTQERAAGAGEGSVSPEVRG